MKTILFILGFLAIFQIGTTDKKPKTVYQAQPVDISVVNENGRLRVSGSSVFQIPDSFVWCGSPIQIKGKYYLFFSAWPLTSAL